MHVHVLKKLLIINRHILKYKEKQFYYKPGQMQTPHLSTKKDAYDLHEHLTSHDLFQEYHIKIDPYTCST